MTDEEAISTLAVRLADVEKLIGDQQRLIRLQKKHDEAKDREIVRLQNAIDGMVTDSIESEFVRNELTKRVAELNDVIEQMWADVKSELPKGV